jgi:hypothetical protein
LNVVSANRTGGRPANSASMRTENMSRQLRRLGVRVGDGRREGSRRGGAGLLSGLAPDRSHEEQAERVVGRDRDHDQHPAESGREHGLVGERDPLSASEAIRRFDSKDPMSRSRLAQFRRAAIETASRMLSPTGT